MIIRKTPEDLDKMRRAGRVVAETLQIMRETVRAGMTTKQLDEIAEAEIRKRDAVPSFLGYRGFTGTLCTSINHEIVHGIPGDKVVRDGDIIKIDCGAIVEGFHGDSAISLPVGDVDPNALKLMEAT